MSPRPVANILWEDLHPGLHLIDGDPPGAEPLVLYVGDDGVVRAAYNRCKHQGARLLPVRDCQLRCPRHGWQLDARQMSYDKPVGGIRHPELRVEREGAWVRIFDDALPEIEVARAQSAGEQPGAGSRSAHQQGAFTLRFYAHACLEVQAGNTRLFTDPWLQGPAFLRGWWLSHVPPRDWLAQLCASDGIFISHSHSDHLNPATLRALHDLRPDIPIYIPAFESQSCAHALQKLGFHNLHPCAFEQWHALAGGLRFMVLQDETCRDDSAILFAYGDCRVLNTVDCHNLSPSLLRRVAADAVDVLLTQFAGGASGFPVCWEELLGKDGVARIVKRNRVLARKQVLEWVERCKPAVYVPFANYFTEAHPSDREIQVTNVKNDVYEVCAAVQAAAPETRVWIPSPGATLDVMTRQITLPSLPSRARWAAA
ncbi:MAG: Rieske 2Fe-2S domain-containing protein, partial [Polyangiales bacterium]